MRFVAGSDHAGYDLKKALVAYLRDQGHDVEDLGADSSAERTDYPVYGAAVGHAVAGGRADLGLAVCGTGIGISIAANKVRGIRAAVVHDAETARLAREHNGANVICLGGRTTPPPIAIEALRAFLEAEPPPVPQPGEVLAGEAAPGVPAWPGDRDVGEGPDGAQSSRHSRRLGEIAMLESAWPVTAGIPGDAEVSRYVLEEVGRQTSTIQLIASENFTSPAVLAASGSVLTNKYAEGYPHKRYYGGNRFIDEVEDLARGRLATLFGADHANVQPHAGASANLAAYEALVPHGDTILAMALDKGGHLTHGSPASITSRLWRFVPYDLTPASSDPDVPGEVIDLDSLAEIAERERPRLIVVGTTAYTRQIHPKPFREIADSVGALLMFDIAHPAGLIAGGAHPNPVPYADVVTLTTHKTLRGPRGGAIVCRSDHAKAIDKAVFPGLQGGPLEHVIAAKAVAFKEAMSPVFREYAAHVVENAKALAAAMAGEGFRLVSGGTENHQVLVDLRSFDAELTGKEAQEVLDSAGITLNRNQIPGDPRPPYITSGLRLGTAAETTAGMGPPEMGRVASLVAAALRGREDASVLRRVRGEVGELCSGFPPYPFAWT